MWLGSNQIDIMSLLLGIAKIYCVQQAFEKVLAENQKEKILETKNIELARHWNT